MKNLRCQRTKQLYAGRSWHRPIFPGSHPPSIVGTAELNFCVRDGNRWDLSVIYTSHKALLALRRSGLRPTRSKEPGSFGSLVVSASRTRRLRQRILNSVCLRHDHCSAPRPRIVPPFGTALSQAPMRFRSFGDPCGNRTRVTGVRGRCLNRLTNGPYSASRLSAKLPSADALKGSRRPFGSRLVSASRTRPSRPSGRILYYECLRHVISWCAIRDSNPGPAD